MIPDKQPDHLNDDDTSAFLGFLHQVYRLKKCRRTGWLLRGIQDGESVADHSYRMAMMVMVMPGLPEGVRREDAMTMALVHDLAEAIVGDITPDCGVATGEKRRREAEAMREITKDIGEQGRVIRALWEEYEAGESPLARFVKQLDKLEFALQTSEYEAEYGMRMDGFFESVEPKVTSPDLKKLYNSISTKRNL